MAQAPKISVCIPTFNRAGRLARLIPSVLGSSLGDLELVISDNASADDTPEVVRGFDDPRIRYFRQETNIGGFPNWNFVVRQATAPLIFRMDDDDYIAPSFLEKMVALMDRHPDVASAYAGYAYTRAYDFSVDLPVIDRALFANRETVSSRDFLRAFLLHDPFPGIHPSSAVYRRQAGERVGFYRMGTSDHIFTLALATQGDVGFIPEVLFYYVQHDEARASNQMAEGIDPYYDPFNLADMVYKGGLDFFDAHEDLRKIRDEVYRAHLRIYSCIELYTVRRNYHRRWQVLRVAARLLREHPALWAHPRFFATLLAMMGPDGGVDWLLNVYRNSRWFQKLAR